MGQRNQANANGVNGVVSVKLAADANYIRLPGFGRAAYPNDPAPTQEVVTAAAIGATQGHARLGTFEIELPALLPHHPAVELLRNARASQAVVNVKHELPERVIGKLNVPQIAAAADKFTPAANDKAVANALIAEGLAFKVGNQVYVVVDYGFDANDDMQNIEISPAAAAQIAAAEQTFYFPKLTKTNIQCTVNAFNEGEVQPEGTMSGGITGQLTARIPPWIASIG